MADIYTDFGTGNDGNTGAWDDPYKTLQVAVDNASANDVIWVGDTAAEVLVAEVDWVSGWGGGTGDNAPLLIRGWNVAGGAGADGRAEVDGNDAIGTIFAIASMPIIVKLYNIFFHSTTGILIDPADKWDIVKCKLADPGDNQNVVDRSFSGSLVACEVEGRATLTAAIATHQAQRILWNYFHGGTYTAATIDVNQDGNTVHGNIVADVSGDGVDISETDALVFGNTFYGQSVGGKFGINKVTGVALGFLNNIFVNWDVGIESDAGEEVFLCGHNLFYNSGTADERTLTKLVDLGNDITGTDPEFANAVGANYACGPVVRAQGYPSTIEGSATVTYVDMGAAQRRGQTMRLINGGLST